MAHTKNPYVLVTGGSKGIGRAICQRLTADGYRILNIDLVAPEAPATSEIHIGVDLCDTAALQPQLDELVRRYEPLRLINNAGIIRPAPVEETTLDDMRSVAALNTEAPLILTQAVLPAMKAASFGRIVNISSRVALGKELRTAYASTKAGIVGMTRTWALELARYGITVNAVGPGPIATELFMLNNPPEAERTKQILRSVPLGRMGEPEEVAHAVASFIDSRAGFITGQMLYICGGVTVGMAPV